LNAIAKSIFKVRVIIVKLVLINVVHVHEVPMVDSVVTIGTPNLCLVATIEIRPPDRLSVVRPESEAPPTAAGMVDPDKGMRIAGTPRVYSHD
jgi:hypothetical protein